MVEVNLLPWRTYQRAYQINKIIQILLATLMCTLILLFSMHHFLSIRETALSTRITVLQNELKHRLSRSTQQKPLSQLLPKRDDKITTLLDELRKINTNNICFTRIIRSHNTTFFIGKAHSAAELTDYLRNWHAATLFSQIKINQLQQKSHTILDFRFEAIGLIP